MRMPRAWSIGMSRGLHVVTGKGGVGTSTIAAGLAVGLAGRGRRVLAIELGEAAGLARAVGTRAMAPGAIATVLAVPGLSVAYFDGAAALAEYLTRRLHLGRLGRAILAHPLYLGFVAAAPGLRELVAVGKIRDELVLQRLGDGPRWDAVVVDAGASGHALEHLRMPAAAATTFAAGLLHREAAVNAALLADSAITAIHVVATAEDMPLAEAAEVIARLRGLGLPVGALIVNQCRPAPPPELAGALEALDGLRSPAAAALAAVGRRADGWSAVAERAIAAAVASTGCAPTRLPRVWSEAPLGLVRALAAPLAEACA
jgi:anion-transporting  ArsA/GET3 family ATPase